MGKKANKTVSYIRISDTLAEELDCRIKRLGYSSRSEFFTAAAYAALGYNEPENSHSEELKTWLDKNLPDRTEEQIRKDLIDLTAKTLTAVIAMKGIDIAFENTWEDIREIYHEKTGIWTTQSELRKAYETFEALNKTELARYREKQLSKNHEPEN